MSDEAPISRKGKIARLPAMIREEVNHRLHDGEPGSKILVWLHTLPEVLRVLDEFFKEEPITPQNLSEWRKGGYTEWLAKRDEVENMKVLSDYAMRLAEAAGSSVSDGAAAIAGGKILEMLESAREDDLFNLSISIAKLRDADSKMLRARVAQRNADQKDRQLDLDEQKFQRSTAELFLKWFEDRRAKQIAESKDAREVKMDQLVQLMFGLPPNAEN